MSVSSSRSGGALFSKDQEDEIFKELCFTNGIPMSKISQAGPDTSKLEMFFSGFPKIIGMENFPNLTCLTLMGQPLTRIEGISCLTKLKELWICDTFVSEIQGLEKCWQLKKLYLYGNQIKKIKNLETLTEIEYLWLNDNQITAIENLNAQKRLKELNLAGNKIEKIGYALDSHQCLETLNLSSNKIFSFKEVSQLVRLPFLRNLCLKDPMYGPCPVCLLCNYTTHVLYHLPTLSRLDGTDVNSKSLRDLAEATVDKKKMFYNMRVNAIKQKSTEVLDKLSNCKDDLMKTPDEKIAALNYALKEIKRDLMEMKNDEGNLCTSHDSDTESDKDAKVIRAEEDRVAMTQLRQKRDAIKDRLKQWEKRVSDLNKYYQSAEDRIRKAALINIQRLTYELESGGNLRFEDGSSSDPWFTSCHDLVLSRFCAADYKQLGVVGIKIHRITRVHNRVLRMRFDDRISAMQDDDDNSSCDTGKTGNVKKYLEYLFWVWDPELLDGKHDATSLLEDGFPDAEYYIQRGQDGAVALTNSLVLADRERINHYSRKNTNVEESYTRTGQIIVTKVYIGKNVCCHDTKQINKAFYPDVDSVFRPCKSQDKSRSTTAASTTASTLHQQSHSASSQILCDCANRQSEWFVFDHNLAMPEYVVDFEYITKVKPVNPFLSTAINSPNKFSIPVQQQFDDMPDDTDVINMAPGPRPRPRLIVITDEILLKVTKCPDISSIVHLNLHGNGLTNLRPLETLVNLKKLVVSFNELNKLDELAGMSIEYVDASYNRICSLDGFKNMVSLKYLDVSWNKLCKTREEVSCLRKHCSSLNYLDLRHNRWHKPEGLRLRAIGRIKSLVKLNGQDIQEHETAAALRMAAGSRVSQVLLVSHARLDSQKPRALSLESIATTLKRTSRHKPLKSLSTETHWYNRITSLCLDGMHISKLSNMEKLENLRWASFNDNDITKIEGLDCCRNLEELSLENNCIGRIDGIQRMANLKHLNLSQNFITNLDVPGLERLSVLQYLSVQDNDITSLSGVQKLNALHELYVGNNMITNVRDIFYIKQLRHMAIVDLCGNPVMEDMDNYRLYIIYHLQGLKALDGHAVTTTETSTARDTFGGRLTPDFIAERIGHASFTSVREIDVPNAGIRYVDLIPSDQFINLRSVNLEHNNLSSFGGLVHLANLRVLCLNHNHIESIFPKSRNKRLDPYDNEAMTPVLHNLEVLHLAFNGIKDMAALQVNRLISLKALFLQSNEIQKIEGLEGLQDLRELVLDRNKIKSIDDTSFTSQWNLQELHIEENRIRELNCPSSLENLQRLYLGMNRLQDICELERLEGLPNLVELSVVNNAVARRLLHRPMLVFRMPNLQVIDGITVTDEERTKAELYFMEQNVAAGSMMTTIETSLPGIGPYKTSIPVKVTNMQLNSPDRNWTTVSKDEETLALERRLKGNRGDNVPTGSRSILSSQVPPGYTDRLRAHLYGQQPQNEYYDPRAGQYNGKR